MSVHPNLSAIFCLLIYLPDMYHSLKFKVLDNGVISSVLRVYPAYLLKTYFIAIGYMTKIAGWKS